MSADVAIAPSPGLAWGIYPQRRAGRAHEGSLSRLRRVAAAAAAQAGAALAPWRTRRLERFVAEVRRAERALVDVDDDALRRRIAATRAAARRSGLTRAVQVNGLALLSELSARRLGQRPYDTQILAVAVLLSNQLAEMPTGEGKTLAAGIAALLAALAGIPVHVLTANDYLVARDRDAIAPLASAIGIDVAAITHSMPADERRAAYQAGVVYCTAKELAFDYLRDRTQVERRHPEVTLRIAGLRTQRGPRPLLRGLCMAIIDEADSILLDEAGTPLILSRQTHDPGNEGLLGRAYELSARLWTNRDFHIDATRRRIELTPAGSALLAASCRGVEGPWGNRRLREELVGQALAARHLYRRDRDYLVRDDKVEMIDEPTGRVAQGRSWSRGLHQLIELKEGVSLSPRNETIARITFQAFFARYLRLCGMSGSLREARGELRAVYGLGVVAIAPRCPSRRVSMPARHFVDAQRKWAAVVDAVAGAHARGQPVLVGTESVADSTHLGGLLAARGLAHRILNAAQDADEAATVARAGQPGAITVTTNLAGRGTDIAVAGPALAAGGLLVIACHRNRERRIDRQLHGRAGRQGQPGQVRVFTCLDDALVARGTPHVVRALLARGCQADGRLPTLPAAALAALAQRLEEARCRRERMRLLDADAHRERIFALAGVGE